MLSIYFSYPNGCLFQELSNAVCYYSFTPHLLSYMYDKKSINYCLEYHLPNTIIPLLKNVRVTECDSNDIINRFAYCNVCYYIENDLTPAKAFSIFNKSIRIINYLKLKYIITEEIYKMIEHTLWKYCKPLILFFYTIIYPIIK